MDPISAASSVIGIATAIAAVGKAVYHFSQASERVEENKQECDRLVVHAREIVALLESRPPYATPQIAAKVKRLERSFNRLYAKVNELCAASRLKQMLWRDDIAGQITLIYRELDDIVLVFDLGSSVDVRKMQQEHEDARRLDADILKQQIALVLHNDYRILELLQVQRTEMQEAMMSIHNRLERIDEGVERQLLEDGIHALQRRSGGMDCIPDNHVITSLDVIIFHDKKLGEGGYGSVYKGDWKGTPVAVKILDKGVPIDVLQTEINIWKTLHHPHILHFFGACAIADPPFAISTLKLHGDAATYVRRFPNADRKKLLHDSMLGLVYLHEHSVVHGDLKASNILVDENGVACLSDFGLSKLRLHTTTMRSLSVHGPTMGTARWMSPEQLLLGIINKKTDIYSFAMTIAEIYTGLPPFAHTSDHILLQLVVDRRERPPRPDGMEDRLWKLVQACWAHDPEQRPTALDATSELHLLRQATEEAWTDHSGLDLRRDQRSSLYSTINHTESLEVPQQTSATSASELQSGTSAGSRPVEPTAEQGQMDYSSEARNTSHGPDPELASLYPDDQSKSQSSSTKQRNRQFTFESELYKIAEHGTVSSVQDFSEELLDDFERAMELFDSLAEPHLSLALELKIPENHPPASPLKRLSSRAEWPKARTEMDGWVLIPFSAKGCMEDHGIEIEGLLCVHVPELHTPGQRTAFSIFIWCNALSALGRLAHPASIDVFFVKMEISGPETSTGAGDTYAVTRRLGRVGKKGKLWRVEDIAQEREDVLRWRRPLESTSEGSSTTSLPKSPSLHGHGNGQERLTPNRRDPQATTTSPNRSPTSLRFAEVSLPGAESIRRKLRSRARSNPSLPKKGSQSSLAPDSQVSLHQFLDEFGQHRDGNPIKRTATAGSLDHRPQPRRPNTSSSVHLPSQGSGHKKGQSLQVPRSPILQRESSGVRRRPPMTLQQFLEETDMRVPPMRIGQVETYQVDAREPVARVDGYIHVPNVESTEGAGVLDEQELRLNVVITHPDYRHISPPGPGIHVQMPIGVLARRSVAREGSSRVL